MPAANALAAGACIVVADDFGGVSSTDTLVVIPAGSDKIVGGTPVNNNGLFFGALDEVRYSNIVRSAGWLTTEYNMESAPGTFETIGSEVPY